MIAELYRVQRKDIPRTGALLADAFRNDPMWAKIFQGAPPTDARVRAVFETPIAYCLTYGDVYAVSENLEGVAAWLPGRFSRITVLRMLRSGALAPGMRIGGTLARRIQRSMRRLEKDRLQNMRGRKYVYLFIIGVAGDLQRRGYGGRLLRALIEKCDRGNTHLYLETETEENVSMYEHFGFTAVKQVMLPLVDLPMWEMVRSPGGGANRVENPA